jgi:hypothetical protein
MATTPRKVFEVRGMTDEITTCELCGREELRGTVQMIELDADGNPYTDHYFGTSCAAKAAGWTQREVKERVQAAVAEKRERDAAERRAHWEAREAQLDAWLMETYGTSDRGAIMKAHGFRTFVPVLKEWDAYRETVTAAETAAPVWSDQQLTLDGMRPDVQQGALFAA